MGAGDRLLTVSVLVDVEEGIEPDVDLGPLEAVIRRAVELVGGRCKGQAEPPTAQLIEVSLLLAGDERMRQLNRDYRHMDKPTDVLSFSQREGDATFIAPPDGSVNLGDVIVSVDTARRQAVEQAHPLPRELAHLAVHGTLHLLGYDHQTDEEEAEMNTLERQVLEGKDL
ncbi:MAG: rRNA maturation RNase YbeY [Chloroflexota bacterium]